LNSKTYSVLQYDQIKEEVAHFALTDSGKNYIRNITPITNVKQIESLLEEINEAKQILIKSSSVPIHGLNGIEIVLSQLNKGIVLRPDQINSLYDFLDCCRKLKRYMKDKEFLAPRVSTYVYGIDELPKLAEEIFRCIRNGSVDSYASKNLEKIRKQIGIQEERLKEKINQILKSSKYKPYLQEAIISQRDGRFVIPVKKEYKAKIKGAILDTSASGSTIYIEPQEVMTYQEELILLQVEEEAEVERILSYLTGLVEENEDQIQLAVETMIHYDVLFAKAKYSHSINGRSVEVNESHFIDLKEARHPLL
jgi:dsDNA-specific endonuclease/ATPase MutS2